MVLACFWIFAAFIGGAGKDITSLKIIIHADDFGLTHGVNEGIIEAIQKGCVTSTSALVNFPTSQEALSLAKQHSLDIGWHINLTLGHPISDPKDIPSLVQKNGNFHPLHSFIIRSFWGKIRKEDVQKELLAQYQKFAEAGLQISHADGHQHVHVFPTVRDVVRDMVREKKISHVRIPSESAGLLLPRLIARAFLNLLTTNLDFGTNTVSFYGFSLGTESHRIEAWKKLLNRINSDTSEVMMHPARIRPEDDYAGDDFPGNREAELKLLLSSEFKALLARQGFHGEKFSSHENLSRACNALPQISPTPDTSKEDSNTAR